jgi:hypothetical protein
MKSNSLMFLILGAGGHLQWFLILQVTSITQGNAPALSEVRIHISPRLTATKFAAIRKRQVFVIDGMRTIHSATSTIVNEKRTHRPMKLAVCPSL